MSAPAAGAGARLSFPQDEQRQPWLAPLLEAYRIIDEGVAEGIARQPSAAAAGLPGSV